MVNKEGLKQKNRRGKIKRLISPKREGKDLYQRENQKENGRGYCSCEARQSDKARKRGETEAIERMNGHIPHSNIFL
jgi:hypothetical protein